MARRRQGARRRSDLVIADYLTITVHMPREWPVDDIATTIVLRADQFKSRIADAVRLELQAIGVDDTKCVIEVQ